MELNRKDAVHMRGRPGPLLTPTSSELPKDPPHLVAAICAFFLPKKGQKVERGLMSDAAPGRCGAYGEMHKSDQVFG
jgi:hypothetical protein